MPKLTNAQRKNLGMRTRGDTGSNLPKRGLPAAVAALRKLEKVDARLPEEATPEQRQLVYEARKTILEVMMKPRRWSQMRLAAAAMVIDEVCGKMTQKTEESGTKTVNVVIRQGRQTDPL